jgi:hypothetical protein
MKILYSACILCFSFVINARAQETLVTCTSERNTDNSISIYAESQIQGEYTLKLSFPNLLGYKANNIYNDMAFVTITRGKREVVKLIPDKMAPSFSFNYRWTYFPGIAQRKMPADSNFQYLLPGTKDNVIRISKVSNIGERLGLKNVNEYFGVGFIYGVGDTICAARAGTVYTCNDDVKTGEKGTMIYSSKRNQVNIQQKDGTLAHYTIRAPIKLLVAAGDNVVPGQPMAVFITESERYEVMFSVSYLDEKSLTLNSPIGSSNTAPAYYHYLPTLFCISEDGQTSNLSIINQTFKIGYPKELVGTELSKKDKKKLGLL